MSELKIADGVPMSLKQMRAYLQEHHGIPIVIRQEGTGTVECPYCDDVHNHGPEVGHYPAPCQREGATIIIGDRTFIPNYGYTIFEYRTVGDVNQLRRRLR